MLRTRRTDDRGVTLVETLVAVAILGIAGVAVLAGFQMSITASDMHRKQTTGGAYVRSYAEAIQQYLAADPAHWVACVPDHTYDLSALPAAYKPAAWPSGYDATQTGSVPQTQYDDPAVGDCTKDTAVLVTLEVTAPRNRAKETLQIVLQRPCGGTACTG